MSAIDPRTVILLSGIMGGLMSLVMFFLRRNYPTSIKGLGEWAWGLFLLLLAGVSASLRGVAPDFLSVAMANLLITSGTYLLWVGSQLFYGQRPALRLHAVLIVLLNLVLMWFLMVTPIYKVRLLLVTGALFYLFSSHARLMFRHGNGSFSSRFVMTVLVFVTLSQVGRMVTALTMPISGGLIDRSPQNLIYITVYPFFLLLLAIGLVLLATDRLRGELEHLATHDPLTNALTRRHMNQAIEQELERCRRHGRAMAILGLDLDHFKAINDNHGHQAGDQALIRFVDRVNAQLRLGDQLGRFGGEEFVVLLPETAVSEALAVAERIRTACETDTFKPNCTVSIGATSYQGETDTVDKLLARADAAMYRAKAAGRNRVEAG